MWDIICAFLAIFRYRGYLPQPLTVTRVLRWPRQFDSDDQKYVRRLLSYVVYFSETAIKDVLVEQNAQLMNCLLGAGLTANQLVYVQVNDAGSSSPVMLNMLRDAAQLEQRGCSFIDGNNTLGITEKTNDLGEGALIYIDDFIGSGTQLSEARNFAIKYVVGNFSEFVLTPIICEEGRLKLDRLGIEVFSGHVHTTVERPLHESSTIFDLETEDPHPTSLQYHRLPDCVRLQQHGGDGGFISQCAR